ncbi:L-lactate permease [Lucifera butyrica]|nr:L-lactate permease [Lucifera butyrica]
MWHVVAHPYGIGLSALLAFIPLGWLFLSLGVWRWPAHKSCFIALLVALAVAILGWKMPPVLALEGAANGAVMAIWPIMWVIFAAIFTYNITLKTGAMEKIKGFMASISNDRRVQVLLIAWGFGGFLEAAAGFGTAVAIPTAILISLDFDPFFASVLCLLANTVPVAFGAVGIPVITLAKIADVNLMRLTLDAVIQLTPFVLVLPLALIWVMTRSLSQLKGVIGTAIVAGLSFAIPQLLIGAFMGPELVAVAGSLCSMIGVAIWAKISPPVKEWHFPGENLAAKKTVEYHTSTGEQLVAWAPYIFLGVFIIGSNHAIFPALANVLGAIKSSFRIYNGPGGTPMVLPWILTPGTLIMLGAVLGGLVQGASLSDFTTTVAKTAGQLQKTTLTVVTIVAMALVMMYSGMVSAIAVALAMATGGFYPVIAPIIGAMGTFLTGSDTSSNVLFGALQKQTAIQIGADPTWITAANTAGATAGKMISPQSIAVACSATGQTGAEGNIFRTMIVYCIGYTLILGLWVYFVNATRLFL